MKAKHFLLVVIAFFITSYIAFGEKVPVEKAKVVAQNVMLEKAPSTISENSDRLLTHPELFSEKNRPLYYIFTLADNLGFVIIAADDRVTPLLGYSFAQQPRGENGSPSAYSWFMEQLSAQILFSIEHHLAASPEVVDAWSAYTNPEFNPLSSISSVNPMIQTSWAQGCYYNQDCPNDATATNSCNHAYSGCGSTAMAQILKFWGSPLNGVGSNSYTHATYGTLSANFAASTYTYSAMPNSISGNNAEVAQLIYHCGIAQYMDYGPAGSFSNSNDLDAAFRDYFDYSSLISWLWKSNFSVSQWTSMLTDELDAGRPMIYYGNNDGQDGHFFICDGYQGSDFFHFNWGWGGIYDGYFYLSNLNPGTNTFNSSQGAIFNIVPNQTPPPPTTYTMDFESIIDFSLTFDPWTTADVDGSATYTIENHTFPNQGEAMAFICFNPDQVSPAMTDAGIQPHGGVRFGASFSATSPPSNDWFISPQIQLGTGGEFSFWVKSYTDEWGLERYKVALSTTDNNPSSFTVISAGSYLEATTTWAKQTYSLANYNNQQVYVAIQCVSNDAFVFMIDDLEVTTGSTSGLTADFSASQTSISTGETINFVDQTSGSPTSWQWTFQGGTPSSSTAQNPTNIMYNTNGTYDVTLTVSNGTGQDTKTKTGYIQVGAPSYMTLDFEGLTDFTMDFTPWMTADVNGGATYGIQDITFPNNEDPMAYICFNPSLTSPPLTNMTAHSGSRFGASFSSIPPFNPNNKWLISPQIQLGNNPSMSLWVQSYSNDYGLEEYNIGVSTTGTNPSDFMIVNTGGPETAPIDWTKKTYNLSTFANQEVYVGIQCVSNDIFIFMVDDIEISGNVGVDDNNQPSVRVFPNPAKEKVSIRFLNAIDGDIHIQLINSLGGVVKKSSYSLSDGVAELEVDELRPGLYYLIIQHEKETIIKKVTIIE